MDRDARGTWVPGYWPLAGPSFATPYSSGVLERLSNPSLGQSTNSWAFSGRKSVFSFAAYLLAAVVAHQAVESPSDVCLEGAGWEMACACSWSKRRGGFDGTGWCVNLGGRFGSLLAS
jgi:hypothetical protein